MATNPMMGGMSAPMQPQPGASGTEPAAATEICVAIAADGSMSVYTKADEGAAGQAQPAADIGEALKLVLARYKEMTQGNDEAAAFDSGFGKPGPKPSPKAPTAMVERG